MTTVIVLPEHPNGCLRSAADSSTYGVLPRIHRLEVERFPTGVVRIRAYAEMEWLFDLVLPETVIGQLKEAIGEDHQT